MGKLRGLLDLYAEYSFTYDIHIIHVTPIPYAHSYRILSETIQCQQGLITQLYFVHPGYLYIHQNLHKPQTSLIAWPHQHLGIFFPN